VADGEHGEPEAAGPALPRTADAVVIGAGVIGACCALDLAERGLSVLVLERGAIASATTASGEGNLLLSDKLPGPELTLAQLSLSLWQALPARLGLPGTGASSGGGRASGAAGLAVAGDLELEDKGGIMVARTEEAATALRALAADQRAAGVTAHDLDPAAALDLEPELNPDLVAAIHYPEDLQVNPVLATTAILAAARRLGTTVVPGAEVTSITPTSTSPGTTPSGDLVVRTKLGSVTTPAVVVAAGPWSGQVAKAAGVTLPVEPRRGLILVTEPLPPVVRHKVYDAGYLAAVGADDAGLHAAAVVEATRAGTVLIGSTRQRVGFDRTVPVAALRLLAAGAVALFPALRAARAIRAYGGFRPYSPDHLPIIGPAPDRPGLWYATGHEGAGIGLAPGTAHLLATQLTGATPDVDPTPYLPNRPTLRTPP
jgi:glycine/D-amino acid oxidase-like deaminating enzyme